MSLAKKVLKQVYMVTLHSRDDLDDFYDDMQTEGGALYIPDRAITVNQQRPHSRTTEYWLTGAEAELVRNDPRVKAVELNPKAMNVQVDEFTIYDEDGTYARNSSNTNTDLNWGLLRCVDGENRQINSIPWGNGTTEVTTEISLNATGRNVDCIICDGNGVYIGHPEYDEAEAWDTDGSSTRLNIFDWDVYQTTIGAPDTYTYANPGSYHANHVMGTVGGNRQGWARNANLYNLYYYAGDVGNNNFPYVFDYIRQFHINKSANPNTGYKNPTVVNNSWGMSIFPGDWSFAAIDAVTYRGTRYVPSGDLTFDGAYGVYSSSELLASFTGDPYNGLGQRISTSGSEGSINGDFNSVPNTWTRTGGEVALSQNSAPDATYTVLVQGPSTITYRSNVATAGLTGVSEVSLTVTVQDSGNSTITTNSDSDTSVEGGLAEVDLVSANINLPNNEQYSVTFSNSVVEGNSPSTSVNMNVNIVGYQGADAAATVTSLGTQTITGTSTFTASGTPSVGTNDDGYWTISIPFNIQYLSETYNTVYLGTNSYLTFGAGSTSYSGIDINTPALPKIMVAGGDRSAQRIYYGTTGTTGSRIFHLIYEGHTSYAGGVLGSPTIRYEYKFYENNQTQIDLIIEENGAYSSSGTFTSTELNGWGFIASQRIPYRVAALDADIEDAIDAGVITVGAAGNGQWYHDVPGGPDWDNTFEMNGFTYYYMRGTSPTANDDLVNGDYDMPNICVGATDTGLTNNLDRKVYFSDCGPGVDLYAPGTSIMSALNSGSVYDPRDGTNTYKVGKISGTSMASPQVAGLVACIAETYPFFNQVQMKEYLLSKWCADDQMHDVTGAFSYTDTDALKGSENKHAKYHYERPLEGPAYPKKDYNLRPTSGALYPRVKRSVRKRTPE